jgi:UrcA family protein
MNIIKNSLTITACTLLLTAGQAALAESAAKSAISPSAVVLVSPAIGLKGTPGSFESTRITVSYADLNLESDEDVQVLYRLLQRASKEACNGGKLKYRRSVILKSSSLRCYRKSLSNAVSKIDNENLTRFHAG